MAVLTRKEVDDGVRATLRFLSKVEFIPIFRYWFKRSKEGLNPHSERLKIIEPQVDEQIFRFHSERGVVSIISEWPSYLRSMNRYAFQFIPQPAIPDRDGKMSVIFAFLYEFIDATRFNRVNRQFQTLRRTIGH